MKRSVFFLCVGVVAALGIPPKVIAASAHSKAVVAAEDVRVLITAKQNSVLASQIDGRIIEVARKEGEQFRAGDVLVRFDCRLYTSERDQARLEADSAAKVVAAKKTLSRLDSGSQLELDLAENDLAIANSALRGKTAIVDYCTVIAPFDGSVVERFVENYEYRRIGEQLLSIQEDTALTSEFLVPARLMPQLNVGQSIAVQVDDLDETVLVRVIRIGGAVDAVSQTVKLYGEVVERPERLLPGMIGTAMLNARALEQKQHLLDHSAYPVEALAATPTVAVESQQVLWRE